MKIKFNFFKFIITLFVIFVAVILLYQLYIHLYKAASTEFAVQISCEETVNTKGYFIRNEQAIYSGNSKYFDVVINDGGKVSKNGTIANVYSTENSAKVQSEIRDLKSKINEYKSVAKSGTGLNDTTAYISAIKKDAVSVNNSVLTQSPQSAFDDASKFVISVIKHKISVGEITDYSDKIKELELKMQTLTDKTSSAIKYITAPVSGYFSYKTDGLESKLDMSATDDFNAEKYEQIVKTCSENSKSSKAIGKVVEGSDWRICFKSNASKFEKVDVGDTVHIRIPTLTNSKIKCTVVEMAKANDDVYIVLSSNVVTGDLLSQRECDIEIIIDSYKGLRIDKNALRKIDGKDGVFVKTNGILRYREVDVLYIGSTYAVIEYEPLNKQSVQSYDEVVIKGSDLYDGKVIS